MPSFSHLLFFALSHLLLLLLLILESQSCPNSISFNCSDHGRTSLDFPFTNSSLPECGVCTLTCENNNHTMINCVGWNPDAHYQALDINPSNRTIVVGYPHDPCEANYTYSDASFLPTPSVSFTILQALETVFICPYEDGSPKWDDQHVQICADDDDDKHIVYGPYKHHQPPKIFYPPPTECSPKNSSFSIQYNISSQCQTCLNEGGRCFHGEVYCNHRNKGKHILEIILFSAFAGLTAIILLLVVYWRRTKIKGSSTLPSTNKFIKGNRNFETVLRNHASLSIKRYAYSDIKKMTNSFGEKLGQGGFGAVYKGKLLDGRLVAVKLLKNTKGDGQGFINEVASIGRTNHVNVVALLGFCYEHHKRALVYEFMENGSLEKFMLGGASNGQTLPPETLFQIVLGIARGLEYLHRGCKTRILHFDIKPHNILLDEEFCPKISDFGLAKLTPQDKQSKISMSGMRGTVGYIAPEVFCRTFGDVSHKSDVYSYGMMVLEVMGSRNRGSREVESSSDVYFPQWIYKQLEQGEEGETDISMNDDKEKQLKRKMIVVSLWCIQVVPSSRPSMSSVVQMLEGSPETIDIPPMPTFSSPPRLQWDASASSILTTGHVC